MKPLNRTSATRLSLLLLVIALAAGCTPQKYVSGSGTTVILESGRSDQLGNIDPSVAKRCMEGDTAVYKKLFGERYNPCAELGIFLINNRAADEGIALFEKGITLSNSYNATLSTLYTDNMGVMQKTRFANILFDLCLKTKVVDLHNGNNITSDICKTAGELFEKVGYRENAIQMYRKKCELSGKCDELHRLDAPVKK